MCVAELDMDSIHPWIGLDWIGLGNSIVSFNVILVVIAELVRYRVTAFSALSDCQCVQIFSLSFEVNCGIT